MTADPLTPWLERGIPLLLDGGLATELEARGHDLRDPLWSARLLLDDPEAIVDVHRAYLEAGADVATTATYQASVPGLRKRGLSDAEIERVFVDAATLARRACDEAAAKRPGLPAPLVVGSLGPYGAYLADGSEYHGRYAIDDDALHRFHAERLAMLAPHVDLVAFETIPSLREAACVAQALSDRRVTAWVSLCCRNDAEVVHGESVIDCAAALDRPRVVAIGVNCTAPRHVGPLLEALASRTDRPLAAYPNAGESYADGRWRGSACTADEFAALAPRWYAAGARLLGGCCRTGPAHIRAMAAWRSALLRG